MPRYTTALPFLVLAACEPTLESPTPSLESVAPNLVCGEQLTTEVTLGGAGLTPATVNALNAPTLALPDLALTHVQGLDGSAGSATVVDLDESEAAALVTWQDASTMTFQVNPELALAAGVYSVSAAVADGQSAELASSFVVTAAPQLSAVEPQVFCGAQEATTLTLTGTGFLSVNGELPTIAIGTWTATADAVGSCTDLAGPVQGQICTELTVTIPADTLDADIHDVTVTNPSTAGCVTTEVVQVQVVSAPVITGVDPEEVCVDGGTVDVVVNGDGFLVLEGELPVVSVEGDPYTPHDLNGCTNLAGPVEGMSCTSVTFSLPGDTYDVGAYDVIVTNPAPADCISSPEPAVLEIVAPPTITSIDPSALCEIGGEILIQGEGFVEGATVTIGGLPVDSATVLDDTTIEVVVSSGLSTGFHDITVTNPNGCTVTETAVLEIVPTPLVFYIDPPVLYSGVSIEGTLYVAGVTGTITEVNLSEVATGAVTSLTFDASDPEQIKAVIPAGLTEGDYDVEIVQDGNCPASLAAGLYIEADLTVAVEDVDPEFAWTGDDTAVVISATEPVPTGMVQFEDVPRVYLNPTTATGTATALRSITYESATRLDAVIPEGLAVDVYDVIVVNPDGSVGLLAGGLEVTAEAPPEVDSVSPASLPTSTTGPITVYGSDFRTPTVEFTCESSAGTITTGSGTVTASDATTITVEVPTSALGVSVCTLLITNSDGSWVEWSAMSITSPSQNLSTWTAGTTMTTARRAPAAVAGRATDTARYIYAIGGDDGTSAGAFTSIEYASVDKYGEMGAWAELPSTLPDPRTLAGVAEIGRFVYLVGGHDGTAPVSTVLRAQVLDPLEAPEFDSLSINYGTGVELGGGTWIYRIAALFDAADETNPGGESLASDPIVVRLPELTDKIELTVGWTAVTDAVGYRIYRTPTADAGSGTEEWLADVSGGSTTTYTDTGDATDATLVPLPKGALGEWATVATITDSAGAALALQSPCVTVATDPADDSVHYIYVAGGLDGSSTATSAIRYLDITEVSEHEQTVGTFTTSAVSLSSGRYECGAYTVDTALHSIAVDGEPWVYFAGGRTATSTTGVTQGALVTAGGELSTMTTVDTMTPDRAGFGTLSASNFLYAFGGQKASASSGGHSVEILGPPDLDNWNSLGMSMSESRYLMGSAQESAVIFMIGGRTSTASATNTTDQTSY